MPSKDRAILKVKTALMQSKAQIAEQAKFNKEEWDAEGVFHFDVELQGKTITGTLTTTDKEYIVDAKLPLLWRMFEGRIESEAKKYIEQMA